MSPATELARAALERLASGSLGAAALGAGVWLVLRNARGIPPAWRAALWWLVAAKAVLALAGTVPLAWLPAAAATPAAPVREIQVLELAAAGAPPAAPATALRAPAAPARARVEPTLETVRRLGPVALAALWIGVVAFLAARAVAARRRVRRAIAAAVPAEPALAALAERLAARLGLDRAPGVAWSDEVEAPAVAGWARPRILLPAADRRRLTSGELELALAHELAHVARRDLLWGIVPALAERLFFFHPLVRWAAREYALERESACDRLVVERLQAPPERYGRLLLALGVVPRRSSMTSAAVAVSAPTTTALRRRLEMLARSIDRSWSARLRWATVFALALVALPPVRLVAAAAPNAPARIPWMVRGDAPAPASEESPSTATTPRARPTPAATPAPAAEPALATAAPTATEAAPAPEARSAVEASPAPEAAPAPSWRIGERTPLPPRAPLAPRRSSWSWSRTPPPAPPAPPRPPAPFHAPATPRAPRPPAAWRGFSSPVPPTPPAPPRTPTPPAPPRAPRAPMELDRDGDLDGFVLLYADHRSISNASRSDLRKAESLRRGDEPIFLFYYRGDRYVVRDPARVAEIEDFFQKQVDLGQRQAELGAQQADIGARQAELGAHQAGFGAEQAQLAAQQATLYRIHDAADERQAREIADQMDELSRKQAELGRQMDELGQDMDRLGRQMDDLGRSQEQAADEASRQIEKRIADWVDSGVAERVD